jgi:lipoprotein NlpI
MIPARLRLWCALVLLLGLTPAWGQPSGTSAKSYTEFGIANGQKGDYSGAIAAFDSAVEIDPTFAPAYYFRGMARDGQKDYTGALADYSKAIGLAPQYTMAYYRRGTIKGEQADFDGAITDFQQVIKLDPKNAEAFYNLGHVYYFNGDLDSALTDIEQSIELQPEVGTPYFLRALILRAKGRRDEAIKDFQKSLGLNFPYAAFWYWLIEMENGEHGLAGQDLTTALARPTTFTDGDWPSQIGNLLLDKISIDQLVTIAGQGAPSEVKERQCEAYFYGGITKHVMGDDKVANQLFEKAVDTDAKSSEEYVEAKRWLSK